MRFIRILPDTHSWVSTLTLAFLTNGYRVEYIPIEYKERKSRSTFHPVRDTANYVAVVLRIAFLFRPLKVLMAVLAVIFLLSLGWLLYGIVVYGFISILPFSLLVLSLMAIVAFAVTAKAER